MKRTAALIFFALLACRDQPLAPATQIPESPPMAQNAFTTVNPTLIADQVFALTVDKKNILLGTKGNVVWLADADNLAAPPKMKTITSGVLHRAVAGDVGLGSKIYLATGRGRNFLQSPLVVMELDTQTGATKELFRNDSERNEAVDLSMADINHDGKNELILAYFESKYMVTSQTFSDGTWNKGAPLRMATSWDYGDLDGDGKIDTVIGRVYGDSIEAAGDLRVVSNGKTTMIPTDRGVRSVKIATLKDGEPPSLLFVDGWEADYGKRARAQLRHAIWKNNTFVVENIGASSDEYTFEKLFVNNASPNRSIFAAGDKRITGFAYNGSAWIATRLFDKPEAALGAYRQTNSGDYLVLPAAPITTVQLR